MSMKGLYCPEKSYKHWRFYCCWDWNSPIPFDFTGKCFQSNAWPQCH